MWKPKLLLHIYTKRNNFEDTALERSITQIYIKSRSKKKKKIKMHEANRADWPSILFFYYFTTEESSSP